MQCVVVYVDYMMLCYMVGVDFLFVVLIDVVVDYC